MDQQNNAVFQQDLSQQERAGAVFLISLLFREEVPHPAQATMEGAMRRHCGDIECFWHDEKGAGFAAKQYLAQFKDGAVPPQLMVLPCTPFAGQDLDPFLTSQMWDCREDRDRILTECQFQVVATDMLAAALTARERANLDMDFLEALVELYPTCQAVYLHSSGKLLWADSIRSHRIPREDRFIKFAVNARFFNIQGTNNMLVDTLGMSTLFLPDLQYHFHDMDPNWVVNHAYCTASYLLTNNNPVKSGDPIDGILEGQISPEVQWLCNYENALIQPARQVIDICMGDYASGQRSK